MRGTMRKGFAGIAAVVVACGGAGGCERDRPAPPRIESRPGPHDANGQLELLVRRDLHATAPDLQVRRAAEVAQGMKGFLAETLPKAVRAVPDAKLLDDFRQADGDAARALDDFETWLQRDLLPRSRGEPALGRERF